MVQHQAITSSIEDGGWVDQNRLVSTHFGNRRPLHKFFLIVNGAAALSGINNIIAQFIAIVSPNNPIMDVILRVYMIALFVVVVMNELEFSSLIRESKVLTDWVSRGIFYTFLGILGVVEYDVGVNNYYRYRNNRSSYNTNSGYYQPMMPTKEDFVEWYLFLVSWIMFGVGVVYIVMGALCMQRKFINLKNEYDNNLQQAFQPKPVQQPPEARVVLYN